ncbi:MAG: GlcG/HbpS family heme-binding protein [Acidimicrobiales bacterium]
MRVTHELVQGCLGFGVQAGEEAGFKVSCAVVDAHGRTLGILRHTEAGWATPEIAIGKALVAVVYHTPTAELYARWESQRPLFGANVASWGAHRGWYVCEGGVPVNGPEGVLLSIGISGCFPATKDDEVARRAADWVAAQLGLTDGE